MDHKNQSWLRFFISKLFFKNVFYSFSVAVLLVVFTWYFLRSYTRHDQLLELPDLKGLTISEADSVLTLKSLNFVVIDSVFSLKLPPLTVIEQNPLAGNFVKENRRIYLTIISKNKKQVQMPNLIDLTLRRALSKLNTIGLKVGEMIFVPDVAKNVVLKQEANGQLVESGSLLTIGSSVDLTVGDGLSDVMVEMPNLNGLTLEDATILLQMQSINLGMVSFDTRVKDSANAVIYRQRPSFEENPLINLGMNVDIYLKNPKNEE